MIDSHCHLEQKDYDADRTKVIAKCKVAGIKAIVTVCAHHNDLEKTLQIMAQNPGYVFATAAIHPEFIKDIKTKEVENFFVAVRKNADRLVAIGETGLDYFWIKEEDWRARQKELFLRHIRLAESLNKPLVVHGRDAWDDVAQILETEGVRRAYIHMFGAPHLIKKVVQNGWFIGINSILLRSKKHHKIARDIPLENLLLETDAPYLAPMTRPEWTEAGGGKRNDSTAIKIIAAKIAEIKKIPAEEVLAAATKNAVRFFALPI